MLIRNSDGGLHTTLFYDTTRTAVNDARPPLILDATFYILTPLPATVTSLLTVVLFATILRAGDDAFLPSRFRIPR